MRIRVNLIFILQSFIVTQFASLVCANAASSRSQYDNQTVDQYVCPFNAMCSSDSRSCGDSNRNYRAGSKNTGLFDALFTSPLMPLNDVFNVQFHSDAVVSTAKNGRKASSAWQRERYPCNIKRIDLRYYRNQWDDDNIYESVIRTLPNFPVVYTGAKDRNKLFAHLSSLQNLTTSPSGKSVLFKPPYLIHSLLLISLLLTSLLLISLSHTPSNLPSLHRIIVFFFPRPFLILFLPSPFLPAFLPVPARRHRGDGDEL
jgi:hypothetical protein